MAKLPLLCIVVANYGALLLPLRRNRVAITA